MSMLRDVLRGARDMGRLMAGIPSYQGYVAHMRAHHPGDAPMSEADFCRDRQAARFGGKPGSSGCC